MQHEFMNSPYKLNKAKKTARLELLIQIVEILLIYWSNQKISKFPTGIS